MTKRNKIIYWIATAWLSLGMVSSGIVQLSKMKEEVDMMMYLGYPVCFLTILAAPVTCLRVVISSCYMCLMNVVRYCFSNIGMYNPECGIVVFEYYG